IQRDCAVRVTLPELTLGGSISRLSLLDSTEEVYRLLKPIQALLGVAKISNQCTVILVTACQFQFVIARIRGLLHELFSDGYGTLVIATCRVRLLRHLRY